MYPLGEAQKPWPENQWYIAATTQEVGPGTLLGRRLLGKRVVLFRDTAGKAHALSGLCPHRMMPMELGKHLGDLIECAYHGLVFDRNGACVAAPTSRSVPGCSLTRYPLAETGPLLWIWMGDPDMADSVPLPRTDFVGIGMPGWRVDVAGYFHLKARYTLLVDNLFDLSHLSYIHASIVGDPKNNTLPLEEAAFVEDDGRTFFQRVRDDFSSQDDYHRFLDPRMGERMCAGFQTEMIAPGLIRAGDVHWCGPDRRTAPVGYSNFNHAFTPESEHSTHYWTFLSRNYDTGNDVTSARQVEQNNAVVAQDIDALEAIETALQQGNLPPEISMKQDLGGMRARLRLIQMINREAAAQA